MRTWISAARAFADLVDRAARWDGPGLGASRWDDLGLGASRWDGPGLGAWSLRDLVGHTCSAGLVTVTTTAEAVTEDRLIASAAGGMRLHIWLPTRTFELTVHTLDIAAATGLSADLPDEVISDAVALAARIAAATGQTALLALTGRGHLPGGFSVV